MRWIKVVHIVQPVLVYTTVRRLLSREEIAELIDGLPYGLSIDEVYAIREMVVQFTYTFDWPVVLVPLVGKQF